MLDHLPSNLHTFNIGENIIPLHFDGFGEPSSLNTSGVQSAQSSNADIILSKSLKACYIIKSSDEPIDYHNLLLDYVVFPQYRMIGNLTDLPTDLFMNAKAFSLINDPIFVLIDEYEIRIIYNVYHKSTEGLEAFSNSAKSNLGIKLNKLFLKLTKNLKTSGMYVFEIIIKNNIIHIIDCYIFENILLINEPYLARLNVMNEKLPKNESIIIATEEPDIDLERMLAMSKKKGLMIKNLQLNGTQRLDYIIGGNRSNVAPYKFAIIGHHVDKNQKLRYIMLARRQGALQICAVTKLSTVRSQCVDRYTVISESNANKFDEFCWHCKRPTDGVINFYQKPLISSCTVRNTGYISVIDIIRDVPGLGDGDGADSGENYKAWLQENIDEYPEIIINNVTDSGSFEKQDNKVKKRKIDVSKT